MPDDISQAPVIRARDFAPFRRRTWDPRATRATARNFALDTARLVPPATGVQAEKEPAAYASADTLSPPPDRFTDASSNWATSRTSTSSRAAPDACRVVRPSDSITRQNGHATAIWSAPVATASSVRFWLMRWPIRSSIHMRAPPAPQQNDVDWLRGISANFAPGTSSISSRGGSYTWLWRPRKHGS